MDLPQEICDRVVFLVAYHHNYAEIDGMVYQILLEADYLVNANESSYGKENIRNTQSKLFKPKTGSELLQMMYLNEGIVYEMKMQAQAVEYMKIEGRGLYEKYNYHLSGVLLLVMGYFIGCRQKIELVHAYHYKRLAKTDKSPFCKGVGFEIVFAGIGILSFPVMNSSLGEMIALGISGVVALIGLIKIITTIIKYNKHLFWQAHL